ncbi:hypothetical protein JF66_05480 [Cryobacterium sp. MLB-32]|nr:hypothetical protein JF66_05480 [Cryobacterium sp. MLB-32]
MSDTVQGRVPEHRIDTLFPLPDGAVALAVGDLWVDSFHAAGDGSYDRASTFVWGTGVFGLALAAGTLAASAAGNASRRNQASADAQHAWRPLFGGALFVTNDGIYIQTMQGLSPWTWGSIDLMQVVGFNVVIMQAQSSSGPITWRITSEWTELMFALWALRRHPAHPQLRDGSWLPANWLPWATAQGYRAHLDRPQLGT